MILLFDNTYSKRKAEIASSTYYKKVEFVKITTIAFSNCKKKNQSLKKLIEIRLRILEFVHLSNTH